MSTERIFQAGNVALEGTMLGLFILAVIIAIWMAVHDRRDGADEWDA